MLFDVMPGLVTGQLRATWKQQWHALCLMVVLDMVDAHPAASAPFPKFVIRLSML